jgi:hypothetical protein
MIPADVIAQSLRTYAQSLREAQVKHDWAIVEHVRLELLGPVDIHRVARTIPTRWIMALKL